MLKRGFQTHWQTTHLRIVLKCYAAWECKDGLEAGVSESPENDCSFSDIAGGQSHRGMRKTPMIQQAQQRMFWGHCTCPPPTLGKTLAAYNTLQTGSHSPDGCLLLWMLPSQFLYNSVSILMPYRGLPFLLRLPGSISVACIQGNLKWYHSFGPISERIIFLKRIRTSSEGQAKTQRWKSGFPVNIDKKNSF